MKRTAALLLALVPLRAAAQTPPASASAPQAPAPSASAPARPAQGAPRPEDLAQAKELFRKGNALLQSNQNDLALELFLQSRALVPGIGNTTNTAICLDRLGRFDEAIAYYELVLKEFSDKTSEDERRTIATALTSLRRKVGIVDVAANVDGTLVIDGRKRGELPLQAPIRVLPGAHTIRVIKDGYAPAEAVINVKVGEEKAVDLKLEQLTSTGRLKVVDETQGEPADVLVDGSPVGKTPWEGTLGAGRHVIALQGKDRGTGPSIASVVAGQSIVVTLRSTPIGPPLRIDPSPLTASVFIDDVLLGPGPWEGHLPLGAHRVRVVEEGYLPGSVAVDGATRGVQSVTLAIDENHPRWRKDQSIQLLLEGHGAYAFGSALGSDAEKSCGSSCPGQSGPSGYLAGARGVVLLPVGLSLELGGGYLAKTTDLRRTVQASQAAPGQALHSYELSDSVSVSGPYAALGLGYRYRLPRSIRLVARVAVGAHFAASRDTISGAAVRGAEREAISVDRNGRTSRAVDFFVNPELGATASFGRVHVGLGLGLALFLLDGPASEQGDTRVVDGAARCNGDVKKLACVSADARLAGEKPYGPHTLWLPQLSAGYTF